MGILQALNFMVKIANDDTHGYDQTYRLGPDYDCSSLLAAALIEGGFNIAKTSYTGNLFPQLVACGFKPCKAPWKAGDIHLKVGKHVVMSVNEKEIVHASINEKGTTTGGTSGDQTGKEICIRDYYEYSGGWDYHLRYEDRTTDLISVANDVILGKYGNGDNRKKKLQAAGYNYEEVQSVVNSLLKSPVVDLTVVAKDVIKGKYGNGAERRSALEKAGYDYDKVQALVNEMLR